MKRVMLTVLAIIAYCTAINAQSDALSALKMIDGFFDSIKNNSIETDGVTE